jgi:hypothetical protein
MPQVTEADFYKKFEIWLERLLEENPVAATQLGDHRFDHRLGEHHAQARARQEKLLREALAELEGVKTEGWSADAQVDYILVKHLVRSFLREFQTVRAFERSPGVYLMEAVAGVGILLLRDFAPFPKRLESVRARLSEVPRVLKEGKENLEPRKVPKVWGETALEGAKRSIPLFRLVIPALSLRVPRLAPKVVRESRRAARVLEDYAQFLEREILPKAQGDFAAGKRALRGNPPRRSHAFLFGGRAFGAGLEDPRGNPARDGGPRAKDCARKVGSGNH